jgi:hypothetical protein
MKNRALALFGFVLIAVLLVAAPASAKKPEPVGDKLAVWPGAPETFPAGEPFHIWHGWHADPPASKAIGLFGYELEVDGVLREEDCVIRETDAGAKLLKCLHNFPDGMQGQHTFTGRWLAPCQVAVDTYWYPGPCAKRNEIIVFFEHTHVVEFLGP